MLRLVVLVSKYKCEGCGKQLSKSGYYKHRKKCEAYLGESVDTPESVPIKPLDTVQWSETPQESTDPIESTQEDHSDTPDDTPIEEEEPAKPDWFDFDVEEEGNTTDHFPTALKMAAGAGGMGAMPRHPSNAQVKAMHDTNLSMIMLGLGGIDSITQAYGRAVTLDKNLVVKHSTDDKVMTATAQYNWMMEKGINPSALVSTGTIAAALTTYYIVPPILKIRKRSKIKFFKNRAGGLLSRIPFIGRFFKRGRQQSVVITTPDGEANQ